MLYTKEGDIMNYLLKLSGKLAGSDTRKQSKIFLMMTMVLSSILGFAIWKIIDVTVGGSVITMICCIGYPLVILGMLGGILYLMNKDIW